MVVDEEDIAELRAWHAEYLALNSGDLLYNHFLHPTITCLESDSIDGEWQHAQYLKAAAGTMVVTGFCSDCSQLLSHWPDFEDEGRFEHNEQAIGRAFNSFTSGIAAQHGCMFCTLLIQELVKNDQLDAFRRIEYRLHRLAAPIDALLSISTHGNDGYQFLYLNLPGRGERSIATRGIWTARLTSSIIDPCSELYLKYALDGSARNSEMSIVGRTRMDPELRIVRQWVDTCTHNHTHCEIQSVMEPPTRLLCVSNGGVRLELTAHLPVMPRYATLSYCWGTDEFVKLTPDTLDPFQDSIALHCLPATFRDAIYATRKLEIDYIWIDALCIVQSKDDNQEWLAESSRMRSIYGGSYINIAASSAVTVHHGFMQSPIMHYGGFVGQVQTRTTCYMRDFTTLETHSNATWKSHLGSRAWTLQERLLAPRILYLGDSGIWWDCRTWSASQWLPKGSSRHHEAKLVIARDETWPWDRVVEVYSRAHLTRQSDKLIALSGIARRQNEADGDQYCAGMWRSRLLSQLVWRTNEPARRIDPRLPTWAWSTLDGPVTCLGELDPFVSRLGYVEVIDVSTKLASLDPYGAIESGELHLACTAMLGAAWNPGSKCEPCSVNITLDALGHTSRAVALDIEIYMDTSMTGVEATINRIVLVPLCEDERLDEAWRSPTIDKEPSNRRLGCEPAPLPGVDRICHGLVLKRVCHEEKGYFQRIGLFHSATMPHGRWCGDVNPAHLPFMKLLHEVGPKFAASECHHMRDSARDTPAKYVIKII